MAARSPSATGLRQNRICQGRSIASRSARSTKNRGSICRACPIPAGTFANERRSIWNESFPEAGCAGEPAGWGVVAGWGRLVPTAPNAPLVDPILGIDFRPADAALYALASSGELYVVDVATGRATLKSTLVADTADMSSPFAGLDGQVFGVNFNPVADRLRVVSNAGQNLRINVDTGATTTDGALNPGTPSVTAAAYSNSFAAACRTRLYVLDTTTRKLLLQDPPNSGTLTEIGDLGAASANADRAGFEVVTEVDGTSRALALFPGDAGVTIYDLDLATARLSNPRSLMLHDGDA